MRHKRIHCCKSQFSLRDKGQRNNIPKISEKWLQESHFSWYLLQIWNINSWDMWLSTHYFSGLLQDWFHVFLYEIKKKSVWYNFFQGTSVSITFYIFEHYQLWMMDTKAQRVFFPKTPKLWCQALRDDVIPWILETFHLNLFERNDLRQRVSLPIPNQFWVMSTFTAERHFEN